MFGVEHSASMMRPQRTKKAGNISTMTTVSTGSKLGKRSSHVLAAVREAPSKDESGSMNASGFTISSKPKPIRGKGVKKNAQQSSHVDDDDT